MATTITTTTACMLASPRTRTRGCNRTRKSIGPSTTTTGDLDEPQAVCALGCPRKRFGQRLYSLPPCTSLVGEASSGLLHACTCALCPSPSPRNPQDLGP